MLTDKGVLRLYRPEKRKDQVVVQALFLAQYEKTCYVRVGDGKFISPVALMEKTVFQGKFGLGDVLGIDDYDLRPDSTPEWNHALEDNGIWHLHIKKFSVVRHHFDTEGVIGGYEKYTYYRDALSVIRNQLGGRVRNTLENNVVLDPERLTKLREEASLQRTEGNMYHRMRIYTGTMKSYNKGKAWDPLDASIWANAAQTLLRTQDYVDSESHSLIALKLNPFNEKPYVRIIQAAIAQGNLLEAQIYARTANFMCKNIRAKYLDNYLPKALPNATTNSDAKDLLTPLPVKRTGEVYKATHPHLKRKLTYDGPKFDFECDFMRVENPPNQKWEHLIVPMESSEDELKDLKAEFMRILKIENKRSILRKLKKTEKLDPQKKREHILEDIKRMRAIQKKRKVEEQIEKRRQQKVKKENMKARIQKEIQNSQREREERITEMERRKMVLARPSPKKKEKLQINMEEYLENGKRYFDEKCFRQAMMSYEKCLEIADKNLNPKDIHFVIALCEIEAGHGTVADGMDIMRILVEDESYTISARYWLAIGYVKICIYPFAKKCAEKCLAELRNNYDESMIKYWPGTTEVIQQTHYEYLIPHCKALHEKLQTAKAVPTARCHHKNCLTTQNVSYAKQEIFIKDFEFKGMITVECEQNCIVSFHPVCWKAVKEQGKSSRKTDKDFINADCFTPDCSGLIHKITIYDRHNDIKSEVCKEKRKDELSLKEKKKMEKKQEKPPMSKPEVREKKKKKQKDANKDNVQDQSTEVSTEATDAEKEKTHIKEVGNTQASSLPIDPESLEWTKVTVLKPSPMTEEEERRNAKSVKKKTKKKKEKAIPQADLLGDPLDAAENVENEYVNRLKLLKQKKEEGMMSASQLRKMRQRLRELERLNALKEKEMEGKEDLDKLASDFGNIAPIDPENPFFIPEHLRQHDAELEKYLQENPTSTSSQLPSRNVVPCYDGDIHAGVHENCDDSTGELEGATAVDPIDAILGGEEEMNIFLNCSICLEPLEDSTSETLECEHKFHPKCIKRWLKVQSNCPNCRKFALPQEEFPSLKDARHWLSVEGDYL